MGESDLSLIVRFQSGDVTAFEGLVARYQDRVYSLVLRMVGDSEEAMDIVQEVFLKAFSAMPQFKGRSTFYTWLYRIAFNAATDRLRKRSKDPQLVAVDEPMAIGESAVCRSIADPGPTPDEEIEDNELRRVIEAAIGRLSPEHRAVLTLHDVVGMKYREIAEVTGCSLGTVKSRLFYAREQLRRTIGPYLQGK